MMTKEKGSKSNDKVGDRQPVYKILGQYLSPNHFNHHSCLRNLIKQRKTLSNCNFAAPSAEGARGLLFRKKSGLKLSLHFEFLSWAEYSLSELLGTWSVSDLGIFFLQILEHLHKLCQLYNTSVMLKNFLNLETFLLF